MLPKSALLTAAILACFTFCVTYTNAQCAYITSPIPEVSVLSCYHTIEVGNDEGGVAAHRSYMSNLHSQIEPCLDPNQWCDVTTPPPPEPVDPGDPVEPVLPGAGT